MTKVLATDLDGTLFYPKQTKNCIPTKNVEFLRKWIDSGNKVALVTSRSLQYLKKVREEIDRDVDMISCLSTQILCNGKLIRNEKLENNSLSILLDRINKKYHPIAYLMTTRNYPIVVRNNRGIGKFWLNFYKLYWKMMGPYKEPFICSNEIFDREVKEGDIYKVIVFFGVGRKKKKFALELNKSLYKEFSGFEFSWINQVNEITPKNCSKGDGIEFYCKANNIEPKDVYVIGDSGNDITMFKKFKDNSYVMKHASKKVKKYASNEVQYVHNLDKLLINQENK